MSYSRQKDKKLNINKTELFLIIASTIVFTVWLIINFNLSSVISWLSYMFYLIALFYRSIGKWQTHLYNIISLLFYLYICFYFYYVGELVNTIFCIVVSFVFIITWKKNEIEEDKVKHIKVNELSKKEIILVNVIAFIGFILCYIVFKAVGSNEVFLNAFATVFLLATFYLTQRISKLMYIYDFITLCIYVYLWVKTIIVTGDHIAEIYVLGNLSGIIWCIYSWKNWTKMEKQQKLKGITKQKKENF